MSKSKWTAEQKIAMVQAYLSGQGSYAIISKSNGVGETTLKGWVRCYLEQGELGFIESTGNKQYSKDFKTMCAEAVISGSDTFQNSKDFIHNITSELPPYFVVEHICSFQAIMEHFCSKVKRTYLFRDIFVNIKQNGRWCKYVLLPKITRPKRRFRHDTVRRSTNS